MNKQEKALLDAWRSLPDTARQGLLDYAGFLVERYARDKRDEPASQTPLDIPRPVEESVIAAVKRLSRTYPMLNKDNMLHETSALVTQHLLQGRPADEVIDELEMVFRRNYAALQETTGVDNHD